MPPHSPSPASRSRSPLTSAYYLIPLELAAIGLRRHQPQQAMAIYQSVLARVQSKADGFGAIDVAHVYLRLGVASPKRRRPAGLGCVARARAG